MTVPEEWEQLLRELQDEVTRRGRGAASAPAGEQAWERLRQHIERAARLYVTREDLDDVVQNVLMKLQSADALRRLRAARAPAGYLAVMIRNAATDAIRRHPKFDGTIESIEQVSPGVDGVQRLDEERQVAALRRTISDLSDADRLLLRLRFWDEMSIADIARRFGTPYSTVAVRLFRLLRRLRAQLGTG